MVELSGATRVTLTAGNPIAPVKAPEGVTAGRRRRGVDAIVVPIHVAVADFADFVRVASGARNHFLLERP
jgi:shikimate dehydrogenase